jgi:hypothetical protein
LRSFFEVRSCSWCVHRATFEPCTANTSRAYLATRASTTAPQPLKHGSNPRARASRFYSRWRDRCTRRAAFWCGVLDSRTVVHLQREGIQARQSASGAGDTGRDSIWFCWCRYRRDRHWRLDLPSRASVPLPRLAPRTGGRHRLTITRQPNPSALPTVADAQHHINRMSIYDALDAFDSHSATNRNTPLATISHARAAAFFLGARTDIPASEPRWEQRG